MDVKLLHPMWRDFLDTVNIVVPYSPSSIFLIHKFIDDCLWFGNILDVVHIKQ